MYATYPTDYQFHQKYMMSKIDYRSTLFIKYFSVQSYNKIR